MKKIINSPNVPAPVGPYNQAVLINGMLFASGQIAIHPPTGDLITGSIEEETHQVMKNIKEVLKAADMTFDDIVKASVFVKDMNLYSRINAVYALSLIHISEPTRPY